MFKRIIFLLIVIAIIIVGVFLVRGSEDRWLCEDGQWVKHGEPSTPAPTTGCGDEITEPEGDVVITSPMPNEIVSETIIIEGKAKGTWFFEATMPVDLLTSDGSEIVQGFVEATSDWMTEEYVPFKGELKFVLPEGVEKGILVFKTANAAGLPQFDDSFEVPVRFSEDAPMSYSLDELALHNTEQDCWLVLGDKVYDVTKFISSHPGGKAILEGCGKDATELFETRPMGSGAPHSENARKISEDYIIGDLIKVE